MGNSRRLQPQASATSLASLSSLHLPHYSLVQALGISLETHQQTHLILYFMGNPCAMVLISCEALHKTRKVVPWQACLLVWDLLLLFAYNTSMQDMFLMFMEWISYWHCRHNYIWGWLDMNCKAKLRLCPLCWEELQTPNTAIPIFKEIDKNHGGELEKSQLLLCSG